MFAVREGSWHKVLVLGILLLAGAEFFIRGPARGLAPEVGWNDFTGPYLAARAWIEGSPPYQTANVIRIWTSLGGDPAALATVFNGPLRGRPIYPPTAMVLIAPISMLPWGLALTALVMMETAAVICLAIMLASVLALPSTNWRLLFIASVLALAPFHTGICRANPSVLTVVFAGLAVWASLRQRPALAGVFLALSLCLKPPLAVALLAYYLVIRRDLRLSAWCLGATSLVAIVSLGWMSAHGAPWLADLTANVRWFNMPGTTGDFTSADPLRFTLINLQVLVYTIYPSLQAANAIAYLASATLAAALLFLARRRNPTMELLETSIVAVISLLPVYHRSYEAAALVLPLAWVFSRLHSAFTTAPRISLALISVFLVPGGAFLEKLSFEGTIPPAISHQTWWTSIFLPHQIWALLGLSLVLLYARGKAPDPPAGQSCAGDGKAAARATAIQGNS